MKLHIIGASGGGKTHVTDAPTSKYGVRQGVSFLESNNRDNYTVFPAADF